MKPNIFENRIAHIENVAASLEQIPPVRPDLFAFPSDPDALRAELLQLRTEYATLLTSYGTSVAAQWSQAADYGKCLRDYETTQSSLLSSRRSVRLPAQLLLSMQSAACCSAAFCASLSSIADAARFAVEHAGVTNSSHCDLAVGTFNCGGEPEREFTEALDRLLADKGGRNGNSRP